MPSPRGSSNPGIKSRSPALQVDSLLVEPSGNPKNTGVGIYPFSKGSSWPRIWTGASCVAGGFFTSWATGEATKEENADILIPASNAVAHIPPLLEITSVFYPNAVYPSSFMPSGKTSLITHTYVGPSVFSSFILSSSFLKNIYIFGSLDLSCSMWDLPSSLQYVGFSTLIREWTRTPCIGSTES